MGFALDGLAVVFGLAAVGGAAFGAGFGVEGLAGATAFAAGRGTVGLGVAGFTLTA